jgi:hypothetical protein
MRIKIELENILVICVFGLACKNIITNEWLEHFTRISTIIKLEFASQKRR